MVCSFERNSNSITTLLMHLLYFLLLIFDTVQQKWDLPRVIRGGVVNNSCVLTGETESWYTNHFFQWLGLVAMTMLWLVVFYKTAELTYIGCVFFLNSQYKDYWPTVKGEFLVTIKNNGYSKGNTPVETFLLYRPRNTNCKTLPISINDSTSKILHCTNAYRNFALL